MLFKKPTSKEEDDRLSQLIQLKRQERPDGAFWDKFDEELRSKQLAALVRTQSWYERLGKLSILLARKSAAVTAIVCIFTLGIFTLSKTSFYTGDPTEAALAPAATFPVAVAPIAIEQPLFVVNDSSQQPNNIENGFVPGINAVPTYEVNTLTKKSIPVSYQIMAEPKTFTAGQNASGGELGAKVIRTGNHF